MVQIGAIDEEPGPGSQASQDVGAGAESASDTVQIPKIPRADDKVAPDESGQVGGPDPARGLSASGTLVPESASTPHAAARVPASAPTGIAKSPSGAGAPASPAGASPSGAWPAETRPAGPAESVFTPWSARNHTGAERAPAEARQASPAAPAAKDAGGPAEPTLLAGVSGPADGARADASPGGAQPDGKQPEPLARAAADSMEAADGGEPAGPGFTGHRAQVQQAAGGWRVRRPRVPQQAAVRRARPAERAVAVVHKEVRPGRRSVRAGCRGGRRGPARGTGHGHAGPGSGRGRGGKRGDRGDLGAR